jgi:phosphate transport system substrate-binding protein
MTTEQVDFIENGRRRRRRVSTRLGPLGALALGAVLAASGCSSSSHNSSTGSGGTTGNTTAGSATALGGANNLVTASSVTLDGSGANSIAPFFERVFYDYHKANPKTTVNYSPAGSSVGVKDIQAGTVDFGDSEIPMSAADLAKAQGPILQVPVDLGGVAISYNLPGGPKDLKLDGPTLADIFAGTITKWNAPEIAALNPGTSLPSTAIVPVHRADSSGPGWDLDAYLIKTAPSWVAKVGTSKPSKTWPLASVGVGQQLNSGVASYVKQTPGAVGFVEYGYALQAGFVNAALKNQSGAFVAPSIASIAAAGGQATDLSATNFSIIDEPGSGTYPLANFSWTLLDQKQTEAAKGLAVGKLFDYVVTTGQQVSSGLGYAPLPPNAVSLAQQTISSLQNASGTALFSS